MHLCSWVLQLWPLHFSLLTCGMSFSGPFSSWQTHLKFQFCALTHCKLYRYPGTPWLYPQTLLSCHEGKIDWLSNNLHMPNPWWMLLISLFAFKWFWNVSLTQCVPWKGKQDCLYKELSFLGSWVHSLGAGQENQCAGLHWQDRHRGLGR